MKIKGFLIVLVICIPVLAFSKWHVPKASLRSVFTTKGKSGVTELIRLYNDLSFEHLIYTPVQSNKNVKSRAVTVNYGTYTLQSGKLIMTPKEANFKTDRYSRSYVIENSKVYASKWQAIFKKDAYVLRSVAKSTYDMPFFLDPSTESIVSNEDAPEMLDLEALSQYYAKKTKSKKELIEKVMAFIRKEVVFDEKAKTGEVRAILAGADRRASATGVSACLNELLGPANIVSKTVEGYVKKSISDAGMVGTRHSWNIIRMGEYQKLFDVFLGEEWFEVDPTIMIYSHFPDAPEDQLLEEPLTLDQYLQMPYVAPAFRGAEGSTFFPLKGKHNARGELKLVFNGAVHFSSVQIQRLEKGEELYASEMVRNFKTASAMDRTVLSVPLVYQESIITLKTIDGMLISLQVSNNGTEESDITSYYSKNARKTTVIPRAATERGMQVAESSNKQKEATISKLSDNQLRLLMDLGNLSKPEIFLHPLIREAVSFYGTKEIVGEGNNKNILMFFRETGNKHIKSDEVAWCSVFLAYCAKQVGASYTKKATAKSWLDVGEKVSSPSAGDIVVFWREDPDSWKGHVAIYLGKDLETGKIVCLGGNQDDEVNMRMFDSAFVLGYRRIVKK